MPQNPPVDDTFVPSVVAQMQDKLQHATGHTPSIRRTDPLHYVLRLTNERVELTFTWRRHHSGRWKRNSSTLTVDGTPREVARDFDDFVGIFKDPDVLSRTGGRSEIPDLTPAEDEAQLPGQIRQILDNVRRGIKRKGLDATIHALAAATDTGYTLQITGPKGTLQLNYVPTPRPAGTWTLAPRHGFRVYDANGLDLSAQFAGDLKAAMAGLFGLDSAPAVPGQTGRPRQASVSNSVQVRRYSVYRN
ncbi:hypothetical protein ACFWGI_35625 [Streptomyces niveus]|uniref:hypothetical protein n=1 Tax=Streptomyces niveus TaxID=193462 RepID=UPI0036491884